MLSFFCFTGFYMSFFCLTGFFMYFFCFTRFFMYFFCFTGFYLCYAPTFFDWILFSLIYCYYLGMEIFQPLNAVHLLINKHSKVDWKSNNNRCDLSCELWPPIARGVSCRAPCGTAGWWWPRYSAWWIFLVKFEFHHPSAKF